MPEIKLPFGEALKRSFGFAFNHIETFFKISLLWGIIITGLDAWADFPLLCAAGDESCIAQKGGSLNILVMFFASISITVSYLIYVIKRTEYQKWINIRLEKKDFKYIWAMIKLIFAGMAISLFIGLILGIIGRVLGLGGVRQLGTLFSMISFFFVGMFLSRYALVFPAIALENKEISFEASYKITKGNINAIFWGMVVTSLPMMLLNMLVAGLYFALGPENWLINFLFSFVLIMISLFNEVLKASFLAHIYQYFIYFYNRLQKKDEAV